MWPRLTIAALLVAGACTGQNPAYRDPASGIDAEPPAPADAGVDRPGPGVPDIAPGLDAPAPDASGPEADASAPDMSVVPADAVPDQAAGADRAPDLPVDAALPVERLVGYWPFDDQMGSVTAADRSNNRLAGAVVGLNHQTCWQGGQVKGALFFPARASAAGVEVPAGPAVTAITRQFTFTAWVKRSTLDDNRHMTILSRQVDETNREVYSFAFDGPDLTIYLAPPTPNDTFELKWPVDSLNRWVHVAVSYDGTMVRLFAGGEQIASKAYNQSLAATSKPVLHLGTNKNLDAAHQPWDGWLDEITVWSTALPQPMIKALSSPSPILVFP